jgi:hypothetical protein
MASAWRHGREPHGKADHLVAQCAATSKGSGAQCRRRAIDGGTVCTVHGGAAPQVKLAARLRILALVDPALAVAVRAFERDERKGEDDPRIAKIAADLARDMLDRAGHQMVEKLEVSGEVTIADILRQRRAARHAKSENQQT